MASKNSKAKVSLSPHVFFDDVVPEICIDTLCPLWCMTTAIFLEGFPRVQNPNQRWIKAAKEAKLLNNRVYGVVYEGYEIPQVTRQATKSFSF
ncbi:hypothetical protein Bca101_047576 [Brassica carinata]